MQQTEPASPNAPILHPHGRNAEPIMTVRGVDFWYGDTRALSAIDLDIFAQEAIAFIGPSGCGKSTLLRLLNRMQDAIRDARMTGEIRLHGQDIMAPEVDPPLLRRRFGWVAQKPNPFPRSIFENVAYGARLHGLVAAGPALDAHVRRCLERAHLWEEVADRLDEPGTQLSGGQQQRLCIARALGLNPEILLMDEPCSSIDPTATARIEALIMELKQDLAVVIVTHNMEQARRIADRVAVFGMGRLVEIGPTETIFGNPHHPRTQAYLAGRFV